MSDPRSDSEPTDLPQVDKAGSSAASGDVTARRAAVTEAALAGLPSSIATLSSLVKIPSVSWDGFDAEHVRRSADTIAELVRGLGVFENVTVAQAPYDEAGTLGQPAILATRKAKNGRPTVLLYAHHDVQPPGDDALWVTPPYEPTLRGDRLYGRGASDDKAGVVNHLASVQALAVALGNDFDLGISLFIEGEEEYGSRSFETFLHQHKDELDSDVIVVADSGNWDIDTPALTVSLRGNAGFHLTVSTMDHASHSGMFGGAVPDAMLAAITLLATLWTPDGSVAVDGLTTSDLPTPEYTDAQLREEAALLPGVTSIGGGPITRRLWHGPSITITGIDAPSVKNASNTLTPSVRVRISVRVAPDQDAMEAYRAVEAHLRAHAPFGAHLEFADVDPGNGFLVDTSGTAIDDVKDSMAEGWSKSPLEVGIGGSIPFVATLVELFPKAQILITGVEDPDTRAHSPNESQHLGVLKRAILAEALLLERLDRRTV